MKGRDAHHKHHHPEKKAAGGEVVYAGKGSKTEHEAKDKKDKFKRGGAVSVDGKKAAARLDRMGGKSGRSPFSATNKLGQAKEHKAEEGDASEGD